MLRPALLLISFALLASGLGACGDPQVAGRDGPAWPADVPPDLAALLDEIESLPPEVVGPRVATVAAAEPGTAETLAGVISGSAVTPEMRRRALVAVESLGPDAAPALLAAFIGSVDDAAAARAYVALRHVLPPADAWLGTESPFSRRWTPSHGTAMERFERPLIESVQDGSGDVRRFAVMLLAALPPGARTKASVGLLTDAIVDSDARIVADAAYALMASAPVAQAAVPRLLRMLDGQEEDTRDLVLAVLQRIGKHAPEVAPAFLERVGTTDDEELRCSLLVAVAGMGPYAGDAERVLEADLLSGDAERRSAAGSCLVALGDIGVEVLGRVLEAGPRASRLAAAHALGRVARADLPPGARAALLAAARADDTDLAETARRSLGRIDRDDP